MIDGNTTLSELTGLLAGAGLQLVRLARTGHAGTAQRAPRWDGKTLHQPRAWCATVIVEPAHRRDGVPFVFDGEGDDMQSAIRDAWVHVALGDRADEASAPTEDDRRDEAAERKGDERRGR